MRDAALQAAAAAAGRRECRSRLRIVGVVSVSACNMLMLFWGSATCLRQSLPERLALLKFVRLPTALKGLKHPSAI